MNQLRIRLLLPAVLVCSLLIDQSAVGQVYNNFRHRASADPYQRRSINPGAISIAQAGRRRSGPHIIIPGPSLAQQQLRQPTYSSSRYRVYGHGPRRGYIRHYSTAPGPIQYSIRSEAGFFPPQYGVVPFAPPSFGPPIYGPPVVDPYQPYVYPPTILAPPIVVPYGGLAGPYGFDQSLGGNNLLPPASSVVPSLPVPPATQQPVPFENGEPLSRRLPTDRLPLVDEFPTRTETRPMSDAVDRIRSVRYQTSGDGAFRGGDFASAETFYQTAIETAPRRQAAWLRLVWAQVAQRRYEEATATLKTALDIHDDPTTTLVTARDLYGTRLASRALLLTDDLWRWVEQRPQSTDRLLLAAAFYQMTEQPAAMRDILTEAEQMGLNPVLVKALNRLNPQPAAIPMAPGAGGFDSADRGDPGQPEPNGNLPTEPTDVGAPSEPPPLQLPRSDVEEFTPLPPVEAEPTSDRSDEGAITSEQILQPDSGGL